MKRILTNLVVPMSLLLLAGCSSNNKTSIHDQMVGCLKSVDDVASNKISSFVAVKVELATINALILKGVKIKQNPYPFVQTCADSKANGAWWKRKLNKWYVQQQDIGENELCTTVNLFAIDSLSLSTYDCYMESDLENRKQEIYSILSGSYEEQVEGIYRLFENYKRILAILAVSNYDSEYLKERILNDLDQVKKIAPYKSSEIRQMLDDKKFTTQQERDEYLHQWLNKQSAVFGSKAFQDE